MMQSYRLAVSSWWPAAPWSPPRCLQVTGGWILHGFALEPCHALGADANSPCSPECTWLLRALPVSHPWENHSGIPDPPWLWPVQEGIARLLSSTANTSAEARLGPPFPPSFPKKNRFLSGLRSQCSCELVAGANPSHPCKAQPGLGYSTLIPPKSTEPSGQLVAVAEIQGGFSL